MPGQSKTLEDLFEETLKDIYYAERKILVALPKMAKAVNSNELKAAFEKHVAETEGQVDRIQQVFKMLKKPAKGKTCPAILGLVEEADEVMEDFEDSSALDAGYCLVRRPWSITKSPAMAPSSIGLTSWA
jgi:ferritin-like metal-binding protein YciE